MGKKYCGHEQMVRAKSINHSITRLCLCLLFHQENFGVFFILHHSPVLVPDKSIEDGVYVFPLKDVTRQPCVYDVSMLREDASQFKICFTLLSDKSENTA